MRILQRLQTHITDTLLFISHTTNILLLKFRCNISICVRIIKEMPGSIASGTHCTLEVRHIEFQDIVCVRYGQRGFFSSLSLFPFLFQNVHSVSGAHQSLIKWVPAFFAGGKTTRA